MGKMIQSPHYFVNGVTTTALKIAAQSKFQGSHCNILNAGAENIEVSFDGETIHTIVRPGLAKTFDWKAVSSIWVKSATGGAEFDIDIW